MKVAASRVGHKHCVAEFAQQLIELVLIRVHFYGSKKTYSHRTHLGVFWFHRSVLQRKEVECAKCAACGTFRRVAG